MAKSLVGWLLFIALATGASSAFFSARATEAPSLAFRSLPIADGGPGTAVCQRATRALLAAADGAVPTAAADLRQIWDRAALDVIQACADT